MDFGYPAMENFESDYCDYLEEGKLLQKVESQYPLPEDMNRKGIQYRKKMLSKTMERTLLRGESPLEDGSKSMGKENLHDSGRNLDSSSVGGTSITSNQSSILVAEISNEMTAVNHEIADILNQYENAFQNFQNSNKNKKKLRNKTEKVKGGPRKFVKMARNDTQRDHQEWKRRIKESSLESPGGQDLESKNCEMEEKEEYPQKWNIQTFLSGAIKSGINEFLALDMMKIVQDAFMKIRQFNTRATQTNLLVGSSPCSMECRLPGCTYEEKSGPHSSDITLQSAHGVSAYLDVLLSCPRCGLVPKFSKKESSGNKMVKQDSKSLQSHSSIASETAKFKGNGDNFAGGCDCQSYLQTQSEELEKSSHLKHQFKQQKSDKIKPAACQGDNLTHSYCLYEFGKNYSETEVKNNYESLSKTRNSILPINTKSELQEKVVKTSDGRTDFTQIVFSDDLSGRSPANTTSWKPKVENEPENISSKTQNVGFNETIKKFSDMSANSCNVIGDIVEGHNHASCKRDHSAGVQEELQNSKCGKNMRTSESSTQTIIGIDPWSTFNEDPHEIGVELSIGVSGINGKGLQNVKLTCPERDLEKKRKTNISDSSNMTNCLQTSTPGIFHHICCRNTCEYGNRSPSKEDPDQDFSCECLNTAYYPEHFTERDSYLEKMKPTEDIQEDQEKPDSELCIEIIKRLTDKVLTCCRRTDVGENKMYFLQLKQLRTHHLKHMMREVKHIEDIDRLFTNIWSDS